MEWPQWVVKLKLGQLSAIASLRPNADIADRDKQPFDFVQALLCAERVALLHIGSMPDARTTACVDAERRAISNAFASSAFAAPA